MLFPVTRTFIGLILNNL